MLSPKNLHDYQLEGTEFLVNNPRSALLAGLGLGKTIMTLTALAELQAFDEATRVLIIAPKRVAATVWHTEAKNWSHTKHLRVFTAVGSPKERRAAILSSLAFDHGIVTINPENLGWLIEMLEAMKISWPFDTIIFDEFSMFKSSNSQRFKSMEGICCDYTKVIKGTLNDIKSPVSRVYGLTATPAASGIENLWSQVKLLDSGQRLGVRVSHFRKAFMTNTAPPGVQYQKWEPTKGSAENVYDAISDIVKVMLPEDHLDMPDLVQNDIVVDIPVSVRRDMKTLEAEFLLEVKNDGLNEEIIAANAGALANKLMQFCIAKGTEVLCDRGWVAIENVTLDDKVWDGLEWVSHRGLIDQGVREVIECFGVTMTPDHEVLTTEGWVKGGDASKGYDRETVRLPDSHISTRYTQAGTTNKILMSMPCYDIASCGPRSRFTVRDRSGPLIVHNCNGAAYVGDPQDPDYEKQWTPLHDAKLDALKELDDTCDYPLLVAYWFQSDLERIQAKFPKWKVLDKKGSQIEAWNKGKIDRLLIHPACLGPETQVLTESGWRNIVDVKRYERVFDGVEFVEHDGCKSSGVREVINVEGVIATPDHKFLTTTGWREAQDVRDCNDTRGQALQIGRSAYIEGACQVLEMWRGNYNSKAECRESQSRGTQALSRMLAATVSRIEAASHVQQLATDAHTMRRSIGQKLRRSWNKSMRRVAGIFCRILYGHGNHMVSECNTGACGYERRLLPGKLYMGYEYGAAEQQAKQSSDKLSRRRHSFGRILPKDWDRQGENNSLSKSRSDGRRSRSSSEEIQIREVFDLINCGPRNRFLIRTPGGKHLIAHNSAGHGLNLQYGGNTFILYSMFWSLELYQQLIGRLFRQGQTDTVSVNRIVIRDSIEQRVAMALASRAEVQDDLLEYLNENGK